MSRRVQAVDPVEGPEGPKAVDHMEGPERGPKDLTNQTKTGAQDTGSVATAG